MLTNTDLLDIAFKAVALEWVAVAVIGILAASAVEHVAKKLPL